MIKQQPPLKENEEYVSYDVSLFTNVPVRETIEYIIYAAKSDMQQKKI